MRIDSRELLAVGIFGSKSRVGARLVIDHVEKLSEN